MKKLLLAAAALTVVPLLALAAGPAGIDPQRLSDTVKTIASDEYDGRGPATPGEVETVAYIVAQMKADGLQPGGDKAPEKKWDDFKGMDLKGKAGIVLINDPDFETGSGDFGGKAMTYYGRWTYKNEEAARQGALGFIVIHETAPASYGWNTVKNSNTNSVFDII